MMTNLSHLPRSHSRHTLATLLLLFCFTVNAHVLQSPPGYIKPEFIEPHNVVQIFLKAVDRGELIVFEDKLTRNHIIPRRVDYSYELDEAVPIIKVYVELKSPLAVQQCEECEIYGVNAVLDSEGHIIQTSAHIRSK